MTLVITKAGLAAVGMLPDVDTVQMACNATQKAGNEAESGLRPAITQNQQRRPRAGSKLAMMVELLERDEGATVEEMAAALDWQQHTIRGVMSGALVKRFGLVVVSVLAGGRGRVYHIRDAAEGNASEVDSAGE
jgi:hypothetical protein